MTQHQRILGPGLGEPPANVFANGGFALGTPIETDHGAFPVEYLAAGNLVRTLDQGLQPIRWIGCIAPPSGAANMIEVAPDVLGNDCTLRLGPGHRVLLQGWQQELLFGAHQVLAPVAALADGNGVRRVRGGNPGFFQMMFDTHQIVFANGAPCESLHPGLPNDLRLAAKVRDRIFKAFPKMQCDPAAYGRAARLCLTHDETRLLFQNGPAISQPMVIGAGGSGMTV